MLLVDEVFKTYTDRLVASQFFSSVDLDGALQEFDGVEGVVANGYYISAWEAIGREMALRNSPEAIVLFFNDFESLLNSAPECMYYFVESIIGEALVQGAELEVLIGAAPNNYRKYLMKRYAPG